MYQRIELTKHIGPQSVYVSRALCIVVLRSQGNDLSAILRGLKKGQKKEIYFWNKNQNIFFFSAYTDACTSSCKIFVDSERPLIQPFGEIICRLSVRRRQKEKMVQLTGAVGNL